MMINFELALKKVLSNAHPLPSEKVRIEDAVGRVLREDVYSAVDMPPFDKSAVDGYAVRASDLKGAPRKLLCVGLIQAGDVSGLEVRKDECVKIMTGAPLPAGADSVVMVEDSEPLGDFVLLSKAVRKGENVCRRGEDIKRRQKVLARGTLISSSHIAVMAAVGRSHVKTGARPEIAILNTGGEIVPPGARLGKNKIYNSNGPMLEALLKSDGISPCLMAIVKDNFAALKAAIKKGLKADVVLISGGVSMGDYDLVPGVLKGLGVKKIFHKVRIKPGKPLFFGRKGGTIVFGIPGNPVSNFLAYQLFIRPAINRMSGRAVAEPGFETGISGWRFPPSPGRRNFIPVKIEMNRGCRRLMSAGSHGSADIVALARADGFLMAGENSNIIGKNEKVRFMTWK